MVRGGLGSGRPNLSAMPPLPPELAQDIMAYVGCIAGAVLIEEYERSLQAARFEAVQVVDTGKDLNVYGEVSNQSGCCSPAMTAGEQMAAGSACCGPTPVRRSSRPGRPPWRRR